MLCDFSYLSSLASRDLRVLRNSCSSLVISFLSCARWVVGSEVAVLGRLWFGMGMMVSLLLKEMVLGAR